jgi:predicted N-acyltransferase
MLQEPDIIAAVVCPIGLGTILDVDLRLSIHASLGEIDRGQWDACFPDNPEGYDYLMAVEKSGLAGFRWRYLVVREAGMILAAMPAFLCDYALETTLPRGRLHAVIDGFRRFAPGFLKLKLACIGSPCTENGVIGIHPAVMPERRGLLLARLMSGFDDMARNEGCSLHALKDMPIPLEPALRDLLVRHGYVETGGMPTAWRPIDFVDIEDYLATLSAGTRKDMRRKLKAASAVTVERITTFGTLEDRFMALYRDTRERSEWQFEDLTTAYFAGILERMPDRAFCTVYSIDGEVLAFNFLLHDGRQLIDKFFCMDAERGRPYNLYYLSWFENLRYCLDHGLDRYQSGQAYYSNKVRLGSRLTANTMFFRHVNPLLHAILKRVAPFLAGDDGLATGGHE